MILHQPMRCTRTMSNRKHNLIPPMPTARHSVGVLSLQSALVVAGGDRTLWNYIAAVEIFKLETSQWYRTDPLPTACCNISLVAIGSTCYALGGYRDSYLNQALYTTVDDLLRTATPANQTTHSGSSNTQSAWKTLPNTPVYQPATAVVHCSWQPSRCRRARNICRRRRHEGGLYLLSVHQLLDLHK